MNEISGAKILEQRIFKIQLPDLRSNGLYTYIIFALLNLITIFALIILAVICFVIKSEALLFGNLIAIIPVAVFFLLVFIDGAYNAYKDRNSKTLKMTFIVGSKRLWVYGKARRVYGYYITPENSERRFYISQKAYYSVQPGFEINVIYLESNGKVSELEILNTNGKQIIDYEYSEMRAMDSKGRLSAYIYDITRSYSIFTIVFTILIFMVWYGLVGMLYLIFFADK